MENRVDQANPYTNQIFQEAVIRNDVAIAKLLLRYGIYPKRNERNRQGLTALQQSVLDGNVRMSIILLEAGADIESKTSNGWTCLHISAALGDLDMLTTLINHCAGLIALTKNEELPIDLAATREIKIKLAKEMSRVGFSELAQWYMRKLAAREGVFYVLSTDTLLDLACDDNYDKSYSTEYPYYLPQGNEQGDLFIHPSTATVNTNPVRSNDSQMHSEQKMWLELPESESTTYLTCSSGFITEAVMNPTSGEYTRVLNSGVPPTNNGSPQRKALTPSSDGMNTAKSMSSIAESAEADNSLRLGGTLRRSGANKHSQQMQRKPSKIELHIDYTNSTEDDADDDDDADDITDGEDMKVPKHLSIENENLTPGSNKSTNTPSSNASINTPSSNASQEDRLNKTIGRSPERLNESFSKSSQFSPGGSKVMRTEGDVVLEETDLRGRNVRFNSLDSSNEFCNCPNCKKMGYAFSPDIRASSRKMVHLARQPVLISPDKAFQYGVVPAAGYMHPHYYPATTTDKHAIYFDDGTEYKPRKRKKKLFSGIKSIFKDSIRVHRTTADHSPVVDDAGVLFAVSFRERDKAKTIRQRHVVRKSNSFSGSRSEYVSEEVNVYPHNHVVPPPSSFADPTSYKNANGQMYFEDYNDDDVFTATQWIECEQAGYESANSTQVNSRLVGKHSADMTDAQHNSDTCNPQLNPALFDSQTVMADKKINTIKPHSISIDDKLSKFAVDANEISMSHSLVEKQHYLEGTI